MARVVRDGMPKGRVRLALGRSTGRMTIRQALAAFGVVVGQDVADTETWIYEGRPGPGRITRIDCRDGRVENISVEDDEKLDGADGGR